MARGKDSFNCINNYFVNIEDIQILLSKELIEFTETKPMKETNRSF
ncbi:MAG: hypothetical protein IPH42_20555 [Bacteroidetes bacterium]|nr:hypothetical protein [Bacteroidota bacterium]